MHFSQLKSTSSLSTYNCTLPPHQQLEHFSFFVLLWQNHWPLHVCQRKILCSSVVRGRLYWHESPTPNYNQSFRLCCHWRSYHIPLHWYNHLPLGRLWGVVWAHLYHPARKISLQGMMSTGSFIPCCVLYRGSPVVVRSLGFLQHPQKLEGVRQGGPLTA